MLSVQHESDEHQHVFPARATVFPIKVSDSRSDSPLLHALRLTERTVVASLVAAPSSENQRTLLQVLRYVFCLRFRLYFRGESRDGMVRSEQATGTDQAPGAWHAVGGEEMIVVLLRSHR